MPVMFQVLIIKPICLIIALLILLSVTYEYMNPILHIVILLRFSCILLLDPNRTYFI